MKKTLTFIFAIVSFAYTANSLACDCKKDNTTTKTSEAVKITKAKN